MESGYLGCPRILCIDQGGFSFTEISASQLLGLKVCTTVSSLSVDFGFAFVCFVVLCFKCKALSVLDKFSATFLALDSFLILKYPRAIYPFLCRQEIYPLLVVIVEN